MPEPPPGKRREPPRILMLALALGAVAIPLTAHADDALHVAGSTTFSSLRAALAVIAAMVAAAGLTNRFAPKKRRSMRNTAIAALLYLIALGTAWALKFTGFGEAARIACEITDFFGLVTVINLGVLVVFELGLSAVGLSIGPFLSSLLVVVGDGAAVMITLRNMGVELASLLTTSALLTTITAFSLQGTLANVVGGIALQIDDSIRVGDWVQLESGKQGKVKEIRWRYTVIETRDWDTMIVPNATVLGSTVMVLGKREGQPLQHRMWVYFNVDFRFSPADVVEAVNTGLQNAPIEGVALDPKPHAICMDLAKDGRDSVAYYAVRYWLTDLARDDPTSSRVRERIYTALKRAGIPLAIPGARLWVEQDSENRERRQRVESQRRLQAIEAVEFLRPLHHDEKEYVAERLKYALFAPNETITKQGAVAHWLYIIVSGVAEVRVHIETNDKVVAKIQAPGFVGEMGLMTGEPRTATVIALTEVECYRLDKEAFNKILSDRHDLAKDISTTLASRRVELLAVREDLDADAKARALEAEHRKLLGTIQRFFGLDDDSVG